MSVFKFKQFEVDQTGCAMKINTDGVLIAAMANHINPKTVLDIGTGTGVIALMLAQRFPDANIEAVEIDRQASETANKNFLLSIFSDRLSVNNIAIEQYNNAQKFDLIVSNPPFFVNDLKNEEMRKGIARHADVDFFGMLIEKSNELLSETGKLWLILPIKQANDIVTAAGTYQLSLLERIHIHSDESKPAFRQIICLGREEGNTKETDFYIYESFQEHTSIYKQLLKDFFLAF
ncbi:methyltransferase domain-containing protein [Pedobacter chinensis]|uniref:tRNA1(Val) (adenine(37)-N6)-methyltransferase n=1 Tax=Pedobacter chinensis TaxID=2282421 RepID=A0A369PX79_9SPHI|nr:methyltransferase [Pedobacter chinensis]RDC55805.1 methyltransferase domain-containing protein [Pedobacter chinensis]